MDGDPLLSSFSITIKDRKVKFKSHRAQKYRLLERMSGGGSVKFPKKSRIGKFVTKKIKNF